LSLPVEQLEIGIPQGDGRYIKTTFQRCSPGSCEPCCALKLSVPLFCFSNYFLSLLNFFQVSQLLCNLLC
uniref:Uncharacterized protein n=1 Tax=Melopsittacus undulatus TaxID=13146 RepID=A0A8V5H7E0_MELUD